MKSLPVLLLAALFLSFSASCSSTGESRGTGTGGNTSHLYRSRGAATITAASMDGRFVFLSDGSIWNIDWSDARDVSRWRSGESVSVSPSRSSNFPYVLNHERGSSVSARLGKKLD